LHSPRQSGLRSVGAISKKKENLTSLIPFNSCARTSYNLPSQLSRRMASIGYGKKHDFTKGPNYPPPNKYNHKTVFERNITKGKGKSFGVSRNVKD